MNDLTFEKGYCKILPNDILSAVHCDVKYIKRDRLRAYVYANISKPIHNAWVHYVLNYRYNRMTYHKFPVDLWESPCDWLGGKKSWILDWTVGIVLNYTNINHPCPYEGHLYFKADNLSINTFNIEQLAPSVTIATKCHLEFIDENDIYPWF